MMTSLMDARQISPSAMSLEGDSRADDAAPSHEEELSVQRPATSEWAVSAANSGELCGACEWITTGLRLPRGADEKYCTSYLRLPKQPQMHHHYATPNANEEEEGNHALSRRRAIARRLRLQQLDRYLSTVAPLANSTRRLLFGSNCVSSKSRRSQYQRQSKLLQHSNNNMHSASGTSVIGVVGQHPHRLVNSTNFGKVLNVLQGEIAHATPDQVDVLVSDDATTCHILALWSYRDDERRGGGVEDDEPLATLAHVDGPGYQSSLREAFNEHIRFHQSKGSNSRSRVPAEVCKEGPGISGNSVVRMSVHVMGGFDDDDGSSIEITDSILWTLATLLSECNQQHSSAPRVCITLETCAVASANDDGTGSPLGRGLGMDVSTGTTFLAELDDDGHGDDGTAVLLPPPGKAAKRALSLALDTTPAGYVSAEGPAVTLRSMRLWAAAFHPRSAAGGGDDHRLHVVHTHGSNHLIVDPFYFAPHPAARKLAHETTTDDELLNLTSTSPGVEKANFSAKVRQSLKYMNGTTSTCVFGRNGKEGAKFRRLGLNGWVRVS